MIVAIDGPAGAGKSTIAKQLASRLGFRHLDTGATYRAVALAVLRSGVSADDDPAVEQVARGVAIEFRREQVFLNGEDVTSAIRQREVNEMIHFVADNPKIREQLVRLQREIAAGDAIVTEGRDQGTVAFPDADCKIFLTASAEERARRRETERRNKGETVDFQSVLKEQNMRDQRDRTRPVGALKQAADAVVVETDGKSVEQVLVELEAIVTSRQK